MPIFSPPLNATDKLVASPVCVKIPLRARILFWILVCGLIVFAVLLILTSFLISYIEVESIWTNFSYFIRTRSKEETIPNLLEAVDYILVAITILLIGLSLISVAYRVWPPKYKYLEQEPLGNPLLPNMDKLLDDFIEAMKKIDKLILSMTVITLVMAFLVYVLRGKYDNIGTNVIFLGFGVSVVILAIAIYLYLTHRTENKA